MPNGNQTPRTDFPGAEYFNLAPGAHVALGPRLQGNVNSTSTSVPASGVAGAIANVIVDPNWSYGSGIYIVRAYSLFTPADASGQLQIVHVRMGLGGSAGNIFLDLGIPAATLTAPPSSLIAQYERDTLVTQLDIPTYPVGVAASPLIMNFWITCKNNDGAAAHSFTTGASITWHRLNGFTQ